VTADCSRLILGLWRVGQWDLSATDLARLLEGCLDLGIDTVDLADIYHGYQCEGLFGEALRAAPTLRTRLRVISKCGIALVKPARPQHRVQHYNTSRTHILASVENALKATGLEHLDQLLIHRPDPLLDADEVAEAFGELRQAGKVAAFGVSNFRPHQLELLQSRLDQPLITNQVEVSLLHTEPLFDGTLDQAQRLRMQPQAWSPLGGGRLTREPTETPLGRALAQVGRELEATPEQLAIAWLLRHPCQIRPVVGSGRLERIRHLVAAEALVLDRQSWFQLLEGAVGHPVP